MRGHVTKLHLINRVLVLYIKKYPLCPFVTSQTFVSWTEEINRPLI